MRSDLSGGRLSAIVNIASTPAFIYGWAMLPELGTGGAAFTTMIARIVGGAIAVAYAVHVAIMTVNCKPAKGILASLKTVTAVGGPAAFSNAINPAGMAAVTAAVATLGTAAVGGFGAATRVQSLAIVPLLALSSGIGPVVGQNWGAELRDRAALAVRQAFALCIGYGIAVALVLTFFAKPIALLIAGSKEPAEYTAQYLRLVGWSLFGYGILVVANAAVNARSKALWSMGLSLSRIGVIYLPLAWIGVSLFGFWGILGAAFLANLYGAAGGIFIARRTDMLVSDEGGLALRPA